MIGICLSSLGLSVSILTQHFNLTWQHSIEKTLWREFWKVDNNLLHLDRAEVQGSGAGMEPGAGGRWENGYWVYQPKLNPLPELTVTHSPFAPEYQLCIANHSCKTLSQWLPNLSETASVTIAPCEISTSQSSVKP